MTMLTIGNFQKLPGCPGPIASKPNLRSTVVDLANTRLGLPYICFVNWKAISTGIAAVFMYSNWKIDGTVPTYWFVFGPFTSTYLLLSASHLFWPSGKESFARYYTAFFCSSEPTLFPNSQWGCVKVMLFLDQADKMPWLKFPGGQFLELRIPPPKKKNTTLSGAKAMCMCVCVC